MARNVAIILSVFLLVSCAQMPLESGSRPVIITTNETVPPGGYITYCLEKPKVPECLKK